MSRERKPGLANIREQSPRSDEEKRPGANGYPFLLLWRGVNILLLGSLVVLAYGMFWEYSTRSYLKGFSDALVPSEASPEQKVQSIPVWMGHGAVRARFGEVEGFAQRDPENTLNYAHLLQVCGTATNAFVNLAISSDLRARRLLLVDGNDNAKHVVAEVLLDGRWAVVDPPYRVLYRDSRGGFLTKEQLRDPATFREATATIPNYLPSYTYDRVLTVRTRRIPLIGPYLRPALNAIFPGWQEDFDWTLLVERESFALAAAGGVLVFLLVSLRSILGWYGSRRLGIARRGLRARLLQASNAFVRT
jgi:hypothetical protein